MKKLTGIAALLTAMVMLVSCGGVQMPQQAAEPNPEVEIRATVSGFFDALFDYDIEKAKSYADESVVEQLENELSINKLMSSFEDTAGAILPTEKITEFIANLAKSIFKNAEYDITSVEINGDTAEAKVVMKIPDFENADLVSSIDYEGIMKEAFGFDLTDTESFIEKYIERKGTSMEELMSKFSSGDHSEFYNDLITTFGPEFEKFISLIGDEFSNSVSASKKETDGNVTLKKQADNTWKITQTD